MVAHDNFARINDAYAVLTGKMEYNPMVTTKKGRKVKVTRQEGYGGTSDDPGGTHGTGDVKHGYFNSNNNNNNGRMKQIIAKEETTRKR